MSDLLTDQELACELDVLRNGRLRHNPPARRDEARAKLADHVAALRADRDAARQLLQIAQTELLNEDKDLIVALRRTEAERDTAVQAIERARYDQERAQADRDTLAAMLQTFGKPDLFTGAPCFCDRHFDHVPHSDACARAYNALARLRTPGDTG